MAGHSKWAQIKRKKAVTDAKRGAVFGKLGRVISIAARGNPDPASNLRLRTEIERARAANMPMENIERAIKRVSDKEQAALEEIQLEVIGPGGAAIIAAAITDNSNRTVNEVKQLVGKHGARMVVPGSVSWMFRRAGVIHLNPALTTEEVSLAAIDAGADDVRTDENDPVVLCPPDRIEAVRSAVGTGAVSSGVEWVPTNLHPLSDSHAQQALEELLQALDDQDDVQEVQTNASY
jgi:YebC/PmpR family DNA-binding regulatory protein